MQIHSAETVNFGKTDKIDRYKWVSSDKPGRYEEINKKLLTVPDEYQRDIIPSKVKEIQSNWSWFGCGVIIVAMREGIYYIVDGQHRWKASLSRSDIQKLPCLVFDSDSTKAEANAFLTVNTGRKPMSAIGKLKALDVAGDKDAEFVVRTIDRLGLEIKANAKAPMQIKCIASCLNLARLDMNTFVDAIELCAEISKTSNAPFVEKLLSGFFYIHKNSSFGITDKRFRERVISIGSKALTDGAIKAEDFVMTLK